VKRLSKEELEKFKEDYQTLPWEELERKYQRTRASLYTLAHELGIKRRKEKRLNGIKRVPLPSYSELIDHVIAHQSLLKKVEPPAYTKLRIRLKESEPIVLTFTSDWHLGNKGVDYSRFNEDLELIAKTEHLWLIAGGDSWDNFIRERFVGEALDALAQPELQRALWIQAIRKVKRRILAIGTGCHNEWTKKATGIDEIGELVRGLHLLYTEHGALIELKIDEVVYRIFRIHRYRYSSSFNLTHAVKRLWEMGPHDFDVGVVEHQHVAAVEPFLKHGQWKIAIRTGTYKVWDRFARSRGFFGATPMNPAVVLFPKEFKMVPFLDFRDAIEFRERLVQPSKANEEGRL